MHDQTYDFRKKIISNNPVDKHAIRIKNLSNTKSPHGTI